jgi:hypothetical protein
MPRKQRPVRNVDLTLFSHATESREKVKQAARNIVPKDVSLIFREEELKGYYGDPIVLLKAEITRWKPSTDTFEYIFERLSSLDKNILISETDKRIDEAGNLYLRLDKQKAFQERHVLSDSDPIRMKFRFYVPHKTDPYKRINEYLKRLSKGDIPESYAP